MAKLYVFGIGGTGARIIKSLAMLLASGVSTGYEIVPIILDPDAANADVNRTKKILDDYFKIREKGNSSGASSFFKDKISTLANVVNADDKNEVSNNFVVNIEGLQNNETFKSFLDYQNLDAHNKKMIDLLFSEDNLALSLDVGFKGNPNIGSVVLNSFVKSNTFRTFANSFANGDKIFIASSIFGGTGAAGFPLILKNIREAQDGDHFYDFLRNAIVGAISVQPYFIIDKEEGAEIDSHTFITKTKSALYYYEDFVSKNKSLNATYYIGDSSNAKFKHNVGGNSQRNNAHFVELASALAIVDFAATQGLSTSGGFAVNPVYKEFGVKEGNSVLNFTSIADETERLIKKPLAKFFYFNLFLDKQLESTDQDPYAKTKDDSSFDSNFRQSSFFSTLKSFNKDYKVWLGEMKQNTVSFAPFNIENQLENGVVSGINYSPGEDIFNHISGRAPNGDGLFGLSKKNFELFRAHLNNAAVKTKNYSSKEDRFLQVFSQATETILNKKGLIN
ncbi:hypothetical protein [Kaistella sp.]|uniref:hypothetical protein n=1 Tax=Kaistella sp. TaxID=2782235 RepID=UPI002F939E8D